MQKFISFLKSSKGARLLLVVLIAFSFFAMTMHHHEADHGQDCSVCHAVQALALNVEALIFFVWIASVHPLRRVVRSKSTPLFSFFHGALLANRAPPTFA